MTSGVGCRWPASVEVQGRDWMFYPRMTDRTGLVPVIVLVMEQAVVVVAKRDVMAALCCSAAKAVKRRFRMQLLPRNGSHRAMW